MNGVCIDTDDTTTVLPVSTEALKALARIGIHLFLNASCLIVVTRTGTQKRQ
jgi:hypothetical protein